MPSVTCKQKLLQTTSAIQTLLHVCAILCCSCIGMAAGAACAQSNPKTLADPYGNTASTLRLIAAPGRRNGSYEAAVDIAMSKGSHTYWKQPGESGVPPVFAFNGSENVAKAEVAFPVPSRISEEGLVAYGYSDRVAFPVEVTPVDPSKPSVLHADVSYAVCNKICVPAHSRAMLVLPARGTDAAGEIVEAALAQVPKPMSPSQRRSLAIRPQKGAPKPTWTLAWHGAAVPEDIFVDGPEGFFFTTRKIGSDHWMLVAEQTVPGDAARRVPVSLTLKRGDASLVTVETLDASLPAK